MSRPGHNADKLTTERVKTELDKERECLVRLREVVEQQLKVLKVRVQMV